MSKPPSYVTYAMAVQDLTLPARVRVLADLLEGLDVVHDATDLSGQPLSIVHRGLSPANVVIALDGTTKLSDFSVASSRLRPKDKPGHLYGARGYMAPEQIRLETADRRADVFAVGAMLWEAITDQPMRPGGRLESVLGGGPRIPSVRRVNPAVHPLLAIACDRALARKRADRYPTARAMKVALELYLTDVAPLMTQERLGQLVSRNAAARRERGERGERGDVRLWARSSPAPALPRTPCRQRLARWLTGITAAMAFACGMTAAWMRDPRPAHALFTSIQRYVR
jgi:serine/threonine-protein kinase